jgi:hypothetical protein
MSKRHINLNHKQIHGQFFTSNAQELLKEYACFVKNKRIIDPFAGDWDLLHWAKENHASTIEAYDIEPQNSETEKRDSLLQPPNFQNLFLLTNPPYLSSNKNKDKKAYERWGQDDLYKCHLSSLIEGKCDEGIIILPSNFLSESRGKARDLFFKNYNILKLDYYYYQVFPNATTGIVVFAFEKQSLNQDDSRTFPAKIHYSKEHIEDVEITLKEQWDWLWGDEFFEFIQLNEPSSFQIQKWTGKESGFLTNVVLGLLDKGAWKQGLSFNEGKVVVCGEKAFTTYQLVLPEEIWGMKTGTILNDEIQKQAVQMFNEQLFKHRTKYHGLFLSNFMGADQKILSRNWCHRLFIKCLKELLMQNL